MTTPPRPTTYYTVVFGPGEHDRITYPDDMDHLIPSAEGRANQTFIAFLNARVPAGFYINGEFNAGTDLLALNSPDQPDTGTPTS